MKTIKVLTILFTLLCNLTTLAQTAVNAGENFLAANKNKAGVSTTSSNLQYLVLTKGNGIKPHINDKVKVAYELKLIDGTIVDASANYGGAMEFTVADLIPGWKEGVQLMPLASKYRFFIPPNLAYGEYGGAGGKIKPNETVIVDVELIAVNGKVATAVPANVIPAYIAPQSSQPAATINTPALLTYLGDDEVEKKIDGYTLGKKTAGLVGVNGKYYFATPNGNFYQTSGDESSTKVIEKFIPQDFMYLAGTNKYVYYARDAGGGLVKDFMRYDPSTEKSSNTYLANNTYSKLTVNGNDVPGNRQTVDEMFTSPDKDKVFLRTFISDVSTVYTLSDNTANSLANYVYSNKLDMSYILMPIAVNTEIATFDNDIYFNGRVKPTGEYETSVNIYKPTTANPNKYEFKIAFEIKKKGAFIYERFLRTKSGIYSLLKITDSVKKESTHNLFFYKGTTITGSKEVLLDKATDYAAEVLDDVIFVSYKGTILRFDEEASIFKDVWYKQNETQGWDNIQKNKRFLKVGNYLLFSKGQKYTVYNMLTKKSIDIKTPAVAKQPNFFSYYTNYMYAGKNSFYFMDNVDGAAIFTQYNPVNNTYTPFVFPEFKKQSFDEIKAIYQSDNKFVFLTSYVGKKDKPVYKMFMYTEEGNLLNETITEVKPVAKSFDAKLFEQQINSIIAEPKNDFKNIMGTFKNGNTYAAPVNYAKVAVEGIGDGLITNYKDSKTLMYNAESNRMLKEDAAKIMELIEKQLQKIKLPYTFTKKIDYDVASRRLVSYDFNGKMANIELDMLRGSDAEDAANWTVTFRVRK